MQTALAPLTNDAVPCGAGSVTLGMSTVCGTSNGFCKFTVQYLVVNLGKKSKVFFINDLFKKKGICYTVWK
jgi:hypothetical protein